MELFHPESYQAKCQSLFLHYEREILNVLPSARVEHIGSSATSGALSKGDLDIFVGIPKENLEAAVVHLKFLGFHEKLDTLRTDELCMLESETENMALQIVAEGSQFEMFIHFRDEMNRNPKFVDQYNALKLSCIDHDGDKYRAYKSVFIEKFLNGDKENLTGCHE